MNSKGFHTTTEAIIARLAAAFTRLVAPFATCGLGGARASKLAFSATGAIAIATLVAVATPGEAPAKGDEEIWVTSQGTDRLFILREDKGNEMETVSLPPGTGPHLVTFSSKGDYAYVSGMGNGRLEIVRTESRTIARSLQFGANAGTHQAKPSPDGKLLLVTQIPTRKLVALSVDEATESWSQVGEIELPLSPVCSLFRDDGRQAYVTLLGSGLAVVDLINMALVKILPTDGFIACGMVKSADGRQITLVADGHGGHVYRLNTITDTFEEDLGTLGAVDWHSFIMSPDGTVGFGSVPRGDEVRIFDLGGRHARTITGLRLDPTVGSANDQPDHMAIRNDVLYVSLRASGKLARVDLKQMEVRFHDLSPASSFNPANCAGCAVHGVSIRP